MEASKIFSVESPDTGSSHNEKMCSRSQAAGSPRVRKRKWSRVGGRGRQMESIWQRVTSLIPLTKGMLIKSVLLSWWNPKFHSYKWSQFWLCFDITNHLKLNEAHLTLVCEGNSSMFLFLWFANRILAELPKSPVTVVWESKLDRSQDGVLSWELGQGFQSHPATINNALSDR